jgi:hypothetical protein
MSQTIWTAAFFDDDVSGEGVQVSNTGLDVYRHAINHSFTTFMLDRSIQYSLAQYIRVVFIESDNLLPSPN